MRRYRMMRLTGNALLTAGIVEIGLGISYMYITPTMITGIVLTIWAVAKLKNDE